MLVSDILFYERCEAPKERNLLSLSHLYSNGFSISQSLFKDNTKMAVLLLQNNKSVILRYGQYKISHLRQFTWLFARPLWTNMTWMNDTWTNTIFFLRVWNSDWIAILFSSGFLSEVQAGTDFVWICLICIKFECGTWKWIYKLMLWRSGTQDVNAENCSRSLCETVWIILRMLWEQTVLRVVRVGN